MFSRMSARLAAVLAATCLALPAYGQSPPPPPGQASSGAKLSGFELTPPRLAYTDGEVSFWRVGATDWAPAQINTALASGDQLFTGKGANLEVQVASRGFVRAGQNSQLGIESLEPDYLQLRIASGTVSLDLRAVAAGHTYELDTPSAAFTVQRPGYYRVEVEGDQTRFVSRRGGTATVTPAGGEPAAVTSSEEVIVRGTETASVETYAAPELDAWDRWNYERTDQQIEARSDRYLAPGVYGTDDLDRYGTWRIVPTYGAVWIPTSMPAGWAPYTLGVWMHDPFFGWVWVDSAPWGWAPFHYGRWIHVSGYWAWAPGPLVVRSYWSPALVAFFGTGGGSISVRLGLSLPPIGWVALGWGEPIVPWWGPPGCLGMPRWAGWAGPRYVNGRRVHLRASVRVQNITIYANQRIGNAVVVVPRDRFGRARVARVRIRNVKVSRLRPVYGRLGVQARPESRYGAPGRAAAPPRADLERRVYAVREPAWRKRESAGAGARAREKSARGEGHVVPAPRVAPRSTVRKGPVSHRPPFGPGGVVERRPSPAPPRYEEVRRRAQPATRRAPAPTPPRTETRGSQRQATPPRREAPAPRAQPRPQTQRQPSRQSTPRAAPAPRRAAPQRSAPQSRERSLPGQPAERVYRGRSERPQSQIRSAPSRSNARESRGGANARRPQSSSSGRSSQGRDRGKQHRSDRGR